MDNRFGSSLSEDEILKRLLRLRGNREKKCVEEWTLLLQQLLYREGIVVDGDYPKLRAQIFELCYAYKKYPKDLVTMEEAAEDFLALISSDVCEEQILGGGSSGKH